MANIADYAIGQVLTAPSPATSGTSLVLNAGEGALMPASVPYNVTASPLNLIPTKSNVEKLSVTAQGGTTIAAASNGATLPQATINIVAGASLLSAGTVTIVTSAGNQIITYTGKTGTTLTGCTGGTGTMSTGGLVIGDNLTIARTQGGTQAKSIAAGWLIINSIFAADLFTSAIAPNIILTGTINGTNPTFTAPFEFSTVIGLYKNGVRMTPGASNDYVVTNSTTITFNTGAIPTTGIVTADLITGSQVMINGSNSWMPEEIPAGLVDGSNYQYTTSRPYIPGTLEVCINGWRQSRIAGHFAEDNPSTGAFSMSDVPIGGSTPDVITVSYQFVVSVSGNADTVDGFHASQTATPNTLMPLNANGVYDHTSVSSKIYRTVPGLVTLATTNTLIYTFTIPSTDLPGTGNYNLEFDTVLGVGAGGASVQQEAYIAFQVDSGAITDVGFVTFPPVSTYAQQVAGGDVASISAGSSHTVKLYGRRTSAGTALGTYNNQGYIKVKITR